MVRASTGVFQSTLPLRGATRQASRRRRQSRDFNPRSPCGERPGPTPERDTLRNFNPRSPCGERPSSQSATSTKSQFQSTLPLRGATAVAVQVGPIARISIHAPLAGSDRFRRSRTRRPCYFNPRSPCGERPVHGGEGLPG
ncbi:hypothetical protein HMPREF0620_0510 [Parascardovia denticolens DSM 10105 = JCM 12538]|uniref:Uncharacterized protein n=1 Tax=Parascardovia denticolens DSM 10105 = JCM 12538 TaxID=864564 RepID=E6K124_PARDN|nr:hypothetical protein HMPREF0620_0510 [Parascardovia denticolens DSM 10105 = JCM 12538]